MAQAISNPATRQVLEVRTRVLADSHSGREVNGVKAARQTIKKNRIFAFIASQWLVSAWQAVEATCQRTFDKSMVNLTC